MSKKVMLALAMSLASMSVAAKTVNIGLVAPFSGQFAEYGQEFRRGIDLYLDSISSEVNGNTIKVIDRDEEGGAERSKQLAQDLIVQDEVKFLTGLQLTPDALALGPLITKAKVPTVILNAATGVITRRSPYFVRTSFTQFQGAATMGEWAADNDIKRVFVAVTDYAPGKDSLEAFKTTFTEGGGQIVGEVLMPMSTTDFAPYVQRASDANPDAIFMFTPYGAPGIAFIKAYLQLGLAAKGIKLLATGETNEMDLRAIGAGAEGIVTAFHYSPYIDNAENKAFVEAYQKKFGKDSIPNYATVAGYDGMQAMADTIAALGPDFDGDKAMEFLKTWKTNSPRGPISIDPDERDIIQDIYIRRVEKLDDGTLANVDFDKVEAVKDLWKLRNPAK